MDEKVVPPHIVQSRRTRFFPLTKQKQKKKKFFSFCAMFFRFARSFVS